MTTVTQVISTLPVGPDPATDTPESFSTKAAASVIAQRGMVTELQAWTPQVNTVRTEIASEKAEAVAARDTAILNAQSATLSASQAAASAGATVWALGDYTEGQTRYSELDLRTYRARTTHTSSLDPSLDGTNWGIVQSGLVSSEVTASSVTAIAGKRYLLVGVTGSPLTPQNVILPLAPGNGDEIAISPANGLTENTFDTGTTYVRGPAGKNSGSIKIDVAIAIHLKFISILDQWEIL